MQIRKFTPVDYPSIVEIRKSLNIIWPESPADVQVWVNADKNRSPKCKHERFVAEEDGKVVAAASYGNRLDDYHPQKFYINIEVRAPYRRQGIGAALYNRLIEGMAPYHPTILRTDIIANQIQGLPFIEKRGFREVWRETPVHLDVAGFDLTRFAELTGKLEGDGITIKSLSDLKGIPNLERKVYDLYHEAARYIPCEVDDLDIGPFEDWLTMCYNHPSTVPEAFFIAAHGDDFVAIHELGVYPDSPVLMGGLLGTLPAFRGRGIALALMLKAIQYAQQQGLTTFKTCTGSINQPMQALFTKLGFVRDPEWLQCQYDIK
jgi:mycothiol synthase